MVYLIYLGLFLRLVTAKMVSYLIYLGLFLLLVTVFAIEDVRESKAEEVRDLLGNVPTQGTVPYRNGPRRKCGATLCTGTTTHAERAVPS